MDSLPLPIAKEEYMRQVENAVIPQIFKGFLDIFNEAVEETRNEGKSYLILQRFQKFLKAIKKWNDTILKEATDEILKEVPSFKKLIVTILLGNVTILTAIKLKGSDSNIKVKIPPMSVIVHKIYIESARTFYYKPELFLKPEEYINRKEIHSIIRDAVSEALSQCIPIDDILEETIGENYDNPELSGDLLHKKTEEPEVVDSIEETSDEDDEQESEELSAEESSDAESLEANEEPENNEPDDEPENDEEDDDELENDELENDELENDEEDDEPENDSNENSEERPLISKPRNPPTVSNLSNWNSHDRKLPFSFHPRRQNKFHFAKTNMRPIPKLKIKTPNN